MTDLEQVVLPLRQTEELEVEIKANDEWTCLNCCSDSAQAFNAFFVQTTQNEGVIERSDSSISESTESNCLVGSTLYSGGTWIMFRPGD